jgi:hypothetical protein
MIETHIEIAIHHIGEVLECGRINKESRDEVDLVLEIRMLGKLIFPAVRDAILTKLARLSGKSRDKSTRFVLQLIRVRGVGVDEIAKVLCIVGRGTWERRHVERQEELEIKVGLLCSLISTCLI